MDFDPGKNVQGTSGDVINLIRVLDSMDPSHKAAINGSKRGQEGITNEVIFSCWKFPIVKPNFVIFFRCLYV